VRLQKTTEFGGISRFTYATARSPPAIDDAEARFGIVLMQQCDGIDGDPFETGGCKTIP
jgi:hypothetical protein